MRVKELESRLNRRLRQIHKGYAVKNLKRLPSGEYSSGPRRHTVQAKFYLSADTYDRLRREAAERGVKQSALVEEVLQSALA